MKPFCSRNDLIFLLRHGKITGAGEKKFIGSTDVSLSCTGIDQATHWAGEFSKIPFSKIYTSALQRCRMTASLAAGNRKITVDKALNEIHLGNWENHTFDEIRDRYPEEFKARGRQLDSFTPPGGESFFTLSRRVVPFFKSAADHCSGNILFVTHAGVIRTLLCHISNTPLKDLFQFQLSYAQLTIIKK